MGNIVLATLDPLSGAALTSGPYAAGSPPSNLIAREPSDALILTDLSQTYIIVDFGAAYAPRLVTVLYAGTTAAATWRVRGATTQAGLTSSPGHDSGSMPFGRGETGLKHRRNRVHDWIWNTAMPAYRWWRIDISDATNPDGRIVVGNLVMDAAWQPARNIQYGWSIGLTDPSRKPRSVDGQREPLNRRPYLGGEFSIDYGSEADMWGSAFDLDEVCGTTKPALILRDPDMTQYRQKQSIFGLFSQLAPITNPYFRLYSKRYQIEELIP